MTPTNGSISVVVLSYNCSVHIERCLLALLNTFNELESDYHIHVVDNGSKDNSKAVINYFVEQNKKNITLHSLTHNTGTTYSRNLALKKIKSDYILIIDSDVEVNPFAISTLLSHLAQDQLCALVAPRISYRDGSFQLSCDKFPTLQQKAKRFLFLKHIEKYDKHLSHVSEPVEVDYAISACWLLRFSAFKEIGLFDENLFYAPEDVEYCIRVWQAGFTIKYIPTVPIIHEAQELSRSLIPGLFHFQHFKGLLYVMRKHRYFWSLKSLYKRLGMSR